MLRVLLPLIAILLSSFVVPPQTEVWRSVVQVGQFITLTREGKRVILMRGSGTIITHQGLVLTNYHVVKKDYDVVRRAFDQRQAFVIEDELVIATPAGIDQPAQPRYVATLVKYDQDLDVAILQIRRSLNRSQAMPAHFPALSIGDPNSIRVGQPIIAYGYPVARNGLLTRLEGRFLGWYQDGADHFISIDAALSPGFSGGAATNASGAFIAIPTKMHLIISRTPCLLCRRMKEVYLLRPVWDVKEMLPQADGALSYFIRGN